MKAAAAFKHSLLISPEQTTAAASTGDNPVAAAPASPKQQGGQKGGQKGAGKKGSGRGAGDQMQITDINELVNMMAKLVLKNSQEIRALSTSAMTTPRPADQPPADPAARLPGTR